MNLRSLFLLLFFIPVVTKAQLPYELELKYDLPALGLMLGFVGYNFTQINNKEGFTEEELAALNSADIWGIDRWAAGDRFADDRTVDERRTMRENAGNISDIFMYGGGALPLLLIADPTVRADIGKFTVLYLQAMSLNGSFYTGSQQLFNRARPITYDAELDIHERRSGKNRNSFIGGHPSVTASASFFAATIYADAHPENTGMKWALYSAAGIASASNAYLRIRAAKHFPTDVLTGVTLGALSGIMIPKIHKVDSKIAFIPFTGPANGLLVSYKL
jgi:membrane-associated phospholipid phosphatase